MNILLLENKFEKNKFKTLYRTSQSAMDSIYDSIPHENRIECEISYPCENALHHDA